MNGILTSWIMAALVWGQYAASGRKRRERWNPPKARSTSPRLGMTSKPWAVSERLGVASRMGRGGRRALTPSTRGPVYAPSAPMGRTRDNRGRKAASRLLAPSRSCPLAAVTTTAKTTPSVSTRRWR
jgi:hypothetical protein